MKNKWIAITGMVAVIGLTTAQAIPVAGFTGTATLPSTQTPGNNLFVDYSVDLSGSGVYTYSYIVHNPLTDTTSPDFFSVSFNTLKVGAVTGGNFNGNSGGSLSWLTATPIPPGGSSIPLFFTSLLAPTFGNGNAADAVPPSPWAIDHGLPVPTVPDGGLTVLLLGAALSGLGLLRKKLAV